MIWPLSRNCFDGKKGPKTERIIRIETKQEPEIKCLYRNISRTSSKVETLDYECKGPCLGVRARLNPGKVYKE